MVSWLCPRRQRLWIRDTTELSNFIQRPLPPGGSGTGAPPAGGQGTAGALGMGLQVATGLSVLFNLLENTTPLVRIVVELAVGVCQ